MKAGYTVINDISFFKKNYFILVDNYHSRNEVFNTSIDPSIFKKVKTKYSVGVWRKKIINE